MTLREHLEAIRDDMAALPVEATYRANREARTHAIAALAILDECRHELRGSRISHGHEIVLDKWDLYCLVPERYIGEDRP